MSAVCQYFLRGQCRFGDTCRNEHPAGGAAGQGGGFGNSAWNKTTSSNNATNNNNDNKVLSYTADSIRDDLTANKDKPMWPLSSYGPAKGEPLVISGLDLSFEEMRCKAFEANKAGNAQEYVSYEAAQIASAENTFTNARTNFSQVFETAKRQSSNSGPAPASGFGAFASSGTSAFGAPSTNSAFGAPSTASAFGAPSTTSAFGGNATQSSTSAFGAPAATSAFGNLTSTTTTSAFGTPAFGAPAAPAAATTSAFGAPKPGFGQSAFGQTGFGGGSTTATAPTTTAPTSAFGQPAFGQSAFGTSAQPAGGSSLIKPASGFGAYAGGGTSAFGSGGTSTTTNPPAGGGNAFSAFSGSQPSAFAAAAANKPAGGSQPTRLEEVPLEHPRNPRQEQGSQRLRTYRVRRRQPSAFGQPAQTAPTSAFGQPSQPASAFSGGGSFGQPGSSQPVVSAFGQPQQQPSAFNGGGSAFSAGGGGGGFSAFASASNSSFGPSSSSPFNKPSTATTNPFGPPSQGGASTAGAGAKPDFSQAKFNYRPGIAPSDARLPANYIPGQGSVLPEAVLAAFAALKFEWGKVPEWVPPVQLRVRHQGESVFS
ncbi:hypothetical protein BKA70DRAFT_1556976 [Coprinopsis sp. MPI-PUGE-AT-0042]|nr:hypothetical protein BKA70DRAFT_1556976 [Coprinopsis sp. MPI-PUGE-AT-0042]